MDVRDYTHTILSKIINSLFQSTPQSYVGQKPNMACAPREVPQVFSVWVQYW